jgi:non-ribosomal peptide synthetase component F
VLIHIQAIVASPRSGNDFSVTVNYRSEVISQAEIDVILDHFIAALIFLTCHPNDIIGNINLINEDEQHRLVYDMNPGELHPTQNISELIEAQASQTPEKIAVSVALR